MDLLHIKEWVAEKGNQDILLKKMVYIVKLVNLLTKEEN